MATIKQNNINFTNVQASNIYAAGGKFSLSMNDDGTGKFDTTLTGDEISKSLNAIEIDWNGAQLDNVELPNVLNNGNTVNTTGQLLALINDLQEQINAIVYIMNGGNTGGSENISTTTSTSSIIPPQSPGLTSTTTLGPGTTTITPVTTLR